MKKYWGTLTCGHCADNWNVDFKVWHSMTIPRFTKKLGGNVVKCPKCGLAERVRILSSGMDKSEVRSDF